MQFLLLWCFSIMNTMAMENASIPIPEGMLFSKGSESWNMEAGKTITTSGGTFYDDGGGSGTYSSNFKGTMVFKPQTPGAKIRVSFTSFNVESATDCKYDHLVIYDGADDSAPELGKFCGTDQPGTFTSTAEDGSLCFYFKSDYGGNRSGWEAQISEYIPTDMTYSSAEAIQTNTALAAVGAENIEVIGVKVSVAGDINPLAVTSLDFNTTGTTNTSEIAKAKVFYTGSSSVFNTTTVFGELVSPSGDFTISGNQTLAPGDNYFWLAYDLGENSTEGNTIDAQCTRLVVAETEHIPAVTNPDGQRTLKEMVLLESGTKNFKVTKSIPFYDNGGPSAPYSKDFTGVIVFEPKDENHKVQINFSSCNASTLTIYNGNSTSADKIGSYYSSANPGLVKSTSDDGCLTVKLQSYANVYDGWEAQVSNYEPQPMAYESGEVFQEETGLVAPGDLNQELIGFKVVTSGLLSPVSVENLKINLAATTDVRNIEKLTVYFGGKTKDFTSSENVKIGEVTAISGNEVSVSLSQKLALGDNYFWISADVSATAVDNNVIDAQITAITVAGEEHIPANANPDGQRTIKNMYLLKSGTKTVKVINSLLFYDEGGVDGNYSKNFEGIAIFEPEDADHKVQIDFSSFNTGYYHKLTIYNGRGITAEKIDEYSGTTSPGLLKSTSADGCLTVRFKVGYGTATPGWEATVSNYEPQPMTYVSSVGFQDNTTSLSPGDVKQEIVGFTVKTTGLLSPLTAEGVVFDLSSVTNIADITKAYLYYSDDAKNFASSGNIKIAETTEINGGTLTFNFSRALALGDNHFWLAVDVNGSAQQNNIIDAGVSKLIISGSDYTPQSSNPEGRRVVKRVYKMEQSGSKEITTSGGMFYDDGGAEYDYSSGCAGTVVFKPMDPNNKIRITFNSFDTESGYDYMYIYDGADRSSPELGKFSGASNPPQFTSSAADGSLCIFFDSDSGSEESGWEAEISEYTPAPMSVVSSETVEYSTAEVCKGTEAAPIIGLKVVTTGSLSPKSVDKIKVDLRSTQNISKIKVYYTGKSNTFDRADLVGEKNVTEAIEEVALGKQLGTGDNFLWVAYDIDANANAGDYAKAEVTEIVVSETVHKNTQANLTGRQVQDYVKMPGTKGNTIVVGDEIHFYDDGGKDGLHAKDILGSLTFIPANSEKKVKVEFSEFELQNYGVDFQVYNGKSNEGLNRIADLKGSEIPDPVKSTSEDGALHFYFKSASMFTQKPGWVSRVYCYEPKPLEVAKSEATQRERKFLQRNTKDQLILGIELTVSGEKDVIDFTKMSFSTEGSTLPTDIASAKLYYTNGLSMFTTAELLDEVNSPTGDFTFEFNKQVKREGTYYYWLCFDIANDAVPGDIIDAVLKSVTANGEVQKATIGNPLGKRVIRKALAGTYLIDANPAVDADFVSLEEAAEALNTLGVNGSVTFNIAPGEYEGAFTLNEISGASNVNRITFTSSTGNREDVMVKWNGTESANVVVTINGADYVTFEHLSFVNKGARYCRLLDMYGGANNNKFVDNLFEGIEVSATEYNDDKTLIFCADLKHKSLDNNNEFTGNTFKFGKMAMNIRGLSALTDFETGLVIKNNTFYNQFSKSIYLNYQDNLLIEGNTFTQNDCKREYQAIDIFQSHRNVKIVKNKFNLDCAYKGGTAIFLRNFNSVDASRTLVANNFISMTSTSREVMGIELEDIDYIDVFHNSVKISGSNTLSKAVFVDQRGSGIADNLRFKNNIFAVYTGGYALWSKIQASNSVFANNNYYSDNTAEHFMKFGDIVVTSLEDWKTAIGNDENSISIEPGFVGDNDLHITGTNLKFGTQLSDVVEDIDGEPRNAATPFIGADEIPDATFEGGYPKFTEVTAVSANMALKTAEAGTIYFVVLPKLSELPSVQQIKEGRNALGADAIFNGNIGLEAQEVKSTAITGLSEKTDYDVVLVVEKENGDHSSIIKLLLSTLDVTAPEFIENTPALKDVTDASFKVEVKINERGTVYYALHPESTTNLSAEDVKNGTSAIVSGRINAEKEQFIRCNQLSPGTNYKLYLIAEDDQEKANIQATPEVVSVKTLFGNAVRNFTAEAVEGTKVNLLWQQPSTPANVIVVYSTDNNFGRPESGTEYHVGDVFKGGGEILYTGNASSFEHTSIVEGQTYYYRIYTYNNEKEYSQYLEDYAVMNYDKWTILVYLDGDNNLEGNGIADINEMESVTLPENVNVIVQMDRTTGHDYSNENWTETRRYLIQHDDDVKKINSLWLDQSNPLGELNMGDPNTLSDFIEWGVKSFPAEKTMLILWDHGGGWRSSDQTNFSLTKGVCWDDTDGNDYLEMREVKSALQNAQVKTKKKLNVLGFDVCLAGMMEVGYEVKDVVADYTVFSQALVPGSGWNYDGWLSTLVSNPDATTLDVSQAAVRSFQDAYTGVTDVTMSAMDISRVDELKTLVDEFTAQYLSVVLESTVINGAFNKSDLFSARKNYIDLGLFMDHCSKYLEDEDSKAKAAAVVNKLNEAIVTRGNTGDFENATGLNIYFHKYTDYEWDDYRAPYCDFADESTWKWFVKNYDKDGLAPMFIDGYPKALNVSNTSLDLVVKTNKTGKAYFVVLADESRTPSVSQVKEGKNADGEVLSDNFKGAINTVKYIASQQNLEGLTGATEYDIYIVLEDTEGLTSDHVIKLEAVTLDRKVATFENLLLANNSFWNGADNRGGFVDGGFYFPNNYSQSAWYGFSYSNRTDNTVEGIPGQFTSYAGGGVEESDNYAVAFIRGEFTRIDVNNAGDGVPVSGLYITNNSFARHSMAKGDLLAKKFGGDSGNDPDWFKLTVKGIDAQGQYTDEVEFYLADFRFTDNSRDYIVEDWKWLDLTSLGNVTKLEFRLSSSDGGTGKSMNTPAYFCLDNLNAKAPEDHAPVVKNPIQDIVVKENAAERIIDLNSVFADLDGDELTFEVVSNTNEQLVNVNLQDADLKISFTRELSGSAEVTIKAVANGKSVETTIDITVSNVDHAPTVIKAMDAIVVNENAADKVIDLSKVFTDKDGDSITYVVKKNTNTDLVTVSIAKGMLTIAFTPEMSGSADIAVTATSNGKSVEASVHIVVNAVDHSPTVIKAIDAIEVNENAADKVIDLNKVFTDKDGDSITYVVKKNTNTDLVAAGVAKGLLTVAFTPEMSGKAIVTIEATANGKTVETAVAITVNAVDHAPTVIKAFEDVVVDENAPEEIIDLSNIFGDEDGDELTYAVMSNSNEELVEASISAGSLRLVFTSEMAGDAVVTVVATANGKSVEASVKVTVNAITSIDTIDEAKIATYPNPCVDVLNIKAGDNIIDYVRIVDMGGNVVSVTKPNTNVVTLNVSNLSPGVYIVNMEIDGNILNKRIIKK
ncbi:MAG: DUF4465 domain-containing protein [Marinifilaceae bacterium]